MEVEMILRLKLCRWPLVVEIEGEGRPVEVLSA
jgi:hypothetical protein